MNQYFKNFILCGEVDYHCLLCQETFPDTSNIERHIRWEKHRTNQKKQSYFPKYKKEFIFKVENMFYCEVCNYVLKSSESLSTHIEEEKHIALKNTPEPTAKAVIAKREKNLVVVKHLGLNKTQWHSIKDKTCLLCNTNIDGQVAVHIGSQNHAIKLIQAENVYADDNKVYRKLSANNYYCFTCQDSFPAENLAKHWDDKLHIDKEAKASVKDDDRRQGFEQDVTRKLMESQKEFYNIDIEKKIAGCKRCKKIFSLNFGELVEHNKRHDKQLFHHEVIFDHGRRRALLKEFGKRHFIKLNRGGSKAYCSLCNIYFSPHLFNFKEHLQGTRHVGFLNAKGLAPTSVMYEKLPHTVLPLMEYLKHLYFAGAMGVFWVNRVYCIDMFSFVCVHPIPNKPFYEKCICFVCRVFFPMEKKEEHCKAESHKSLMLDTSFISSLKGEFVREFQPDIYHCAYCNQTFPYWINLKKHLRTFTHKENRRCMEKLSVFLKEMYQNSTTDEMNEINMLTKLGYGFL